MDQKPSVGRVVHYVAFGTPGGEYQAGACRAAIITEVDPAGDTAALCVLNPTGLHWRALGDSVYSETKEAGTWHWAERVEPTQR